MAAGVGRPGSRFLRRVLLVGFVALATVSFAGCQYLLGLPAPGALDPGASFDPEAPFGPPEATYHTGKATVTIGDQVIVMDHLFGEAVLLKEFGADLTWTDGAGWYLRAGGMGTGAPLGAGYTMVTIDHVADGRHLTAFGDQGCQTKLERADKTGVQGTPSCKSLRWTDALGGGLFNGPKPTDEPAFAAEITFEAAP